MEGENRRRRYRCTRCGERFSTLELHCDKIHNPHGGLTLIPKEFQRLIDIGVEQKKKKLLDSIETFFKTVIFTEDE